jgi:hypothetical protein
MIFISKDVYSNWDSPHTFCQYQLDDEDDGLVCVEKILDEEKECKCPFKESDAKSCEKFVYHKHDKNPGAKRSLDI